MPTLIAEICGGGAGPRTQILQFCAQRDQFGVLPTCGAALL